MLKLGFFSVVLALVFEASKIYSALGLTSKKEDLENAILKQPETFVNILGGTECRYDMSYGCSLPLITRPWGFNSYAPMTDNDPTWPSFWFHPSDHRYFGLKVTHQPSPWIGDYGHFLIKPYMPSDLNNPSKDLFTGYSHKTSVFSPYYFSTKLFSYGNSMGDMQIEFSPSQFGGIMKVRYPPFISNEINDGSTCGPFSQNRRISLVLNGGNDYVNLVQSPWDDHTLMLQGQTVDHYYFVVAIYTGEKGEKSTSKEALVGSFFSNTDNWLDFAADMAANDVFTLRFSTSFISLEQALFNMQFENLLTHSLDSLRDEAQLDWRATLSRVQLESIGDGFADYDIQGMNKSVQVFYSSLYRASLYPRMLSEPSRSDSSQLLHWSPYLKEVKEGPLSADSGFWDAWNSVYPLLSLSNRPVLGLMMQGWVNAFLEGGWLPKWASPGYRSSMVGTMGDVSLADAIIKEIPGFDVSSAYKAIVKDAYEVPPEGVEGLGRVCLESYLQFGYIPRGSPMTTGGDCYDVVSRTLNYLHADFAIAQAAAYLNDTNTHDDLISRAKRFNLLFDNSTLFFRAKTDDDSFALPFDQFGWGTDYTEGGPWQYRFYAPYSLDSLRALYNDNEPAAKTSSSRKYLKEDSSDDFFCSMLKSVHSAPATMHVGGNDVEIKEMTEMKENCWGQFAFNDQPIHHLPHLFMFDGYKSKCATTGRQFIRQIQSALFQNNEKMFPGDEDNGEMGAWFVLSSLGLYSRSPGTQEMVLGRPLFGKVSIDVSDSLDEGSYNSLQKLHQRHKTKHSNLFKPRQSEVRNKLGIRAINNKESNHHLVEAKWTETTLDSHVDGLSYKDLIQGGELVLEFSQSPFSSN